MARAKELTAIALFIVMCFLPYPVWAVFGSSFSGASDENRTLAAFPALGTDPIETIPRSIDAFLNDRLPFRSAIVTANSAFDFFALKTSSSNRVILGKDGWLFYNAGAIDDGDPIGQYVGRSRFTEEELDVIASNIERIASYCSQNGIRFGLVVTPNKERFCSEFMPDYYRGPVDGGQLGQVMERLEGIAGVELTCPLNTLETFEKGHPDIPLYYQTDSHWNGLAGYLASREILGRLGVDDPFPNTLDSVETTPRHAGDLASMLNLRELIDGGVSCNPDFGGSAVRIENDFFGNISYENDSGSGRLLVCRDSYATAMLPIMAEPFEEADFVHRSSFTFDLLEEQPDYFVIEVVERYLPTLLEMDLPRLCDGAQACPLFAGSWQRGVE